MKRHEKWLWGGLAEIIHNAADAKSKNIRVRRFPCDDTAPDDKDFGLRIDDDGVGMTHSEISKMFQMGSDTGFGGAHAKKVSVEPASPDLVCMKDALTKPITPRGIPGQGRRLWRRLQGWRECNCSDRGCSVHIQSGRSLGHHGDRCAEQRAI